MQSAVTQRSIIASLQALRPLYPGGIPERFFREASKRPAQLVFIHEGELRPEEQQLLHAAIEKGMKLKAGEVTIKSGAELQGAALPGTVLQGAVAVVLGRLALENIIGGSAASVSRGTLVQALGGQLVLTHPLSDVLRDAALKREFWGDLKIVLASLE